MLYAIGRDAGNSPVAIRPLLRVGLLDKCNTFRCCCRICFLGERLLASDKIQNLTADGEMEIQCNKYENGSIYAMYCGRPDIDPETDPDCRYFHSHETEMKPGIPGLSSGVFLSKYKLLACRYP